MYTQFHFIRNSSIRNSTEIWQKIRNISTASAYLFTILEPFQSQGFVLLFSGASYFKTTQYQIVVAHDL